MKRGSLFFVVLFLFSLSFVSAQITPECNPSVVLINQDPYPAVPGESVKVVFQVDGVDNPVCGDFVFEVSEKFPFEILPGQEAVLSIHSGTYVRSYSSFLLAPYKLVVDEQALDGENILAVNYGFEKPGASAVSISKDFNITVEGTDTDFEVSVKDYDSLTNIITFEILNVGDNDVEALTVEVEKQQGIEVKGSKRNIIGSLDSNEDTTFSFEASPTDGDIKMTVLYTDKINVRRSLEKTVVFDSSYFAGRKRDEKSTPVGLYVFVIAIIILVVWLIVRSVRKKRRRKNRNN